MLCPIAGPGQPEVIGKVATFTDPDQAENNDTCVVQ
jgi:hypothetical protein